MLARCIRSHSSVYRIYTVTEMEFNRRRPFDDVRWDGYHQKAFVKATPSSLLSRLIQYMKRPPAHPALTLLLLSHFRNTLPLPALSKLILMWLSLFLIKRARASCQVHPRVVRRSHCCLSVKIWRLPALYTKPFHEVLIARAGRAPALTVSYFPVSQHFSQRLSRHNPLHLSS